MTGEAVRQFQADGYYVAPQMFDDDEVGTITRHFDDVIAGRYETGSAPHGINRFGSPASMVKVSNSWWADRTIASVVRDFEIAAIASALLGVDELYLWADSLYWKAPQAAGEEAVIGWHQDKQYWAVSSTDDMITACVALYDANEATGGMRFARGSHQWGLVGGSDAFAGEGNAGVHDRPPVPAGQTWDEVCPGLSPGQVTFHHALTFHGSGPNRSPTPRRSITIHMVSGEGKLVNWEPTADGHLSTVGLGNHFRGPLFPRLWP